MGHDIIDHCQGVKDVTLCSASPGRQESTPNFSTLLLSKKKKISYHINNVSKKKKGLNTYLRPVSLSNSSGTQKTVGLLGQTTNFLTELMCYV